MAQANVGSVIVLKGDQLTKADIAGIITERGVQIHSLEQHSVIKDNPTVAFQIFLA